MRIGMTELLLVFIVALFALGPERLPACAKKLGEAVSQFKKYSDEATREIKKSVVEPLEEVQAPLREAAKPLQDLDKAVQGNVKDIKASFAGIGKTPQSPGGEKPPAEEEALGGKRPSAEEAEDRGDAPEETAAS